MGNVTHLIPVPTAGRCQSNDSLAFSARTTIAFWLSCVCECSSYSLVHPAQSTDTGIWPPWLREECVILCLETCAWTISWRSRNDSQFSITVPPWLSNRIGRLSLTHAKWCQERVEIQPCERDVLWSAALENLLGKVESQQLPVHPSHRYLFNNHYAPNTSHSVQKFCACPHVPASLMRKAVINRLLVNGIISDLESIAQDAEGEKREGTKCLYQQILLNSKNPSTTE